MNPYFYKSTGLSLIVGSVLAIITMALHPVGGDFDHIRAIAKPLIFTHALAILCLPFMLFGFYGLTRLLGEKRHLATLALIVAAFGLFAAFLAALFNGLVLPSFLAGHDPVDPVEIAQMKLIVSYGFAVNKALDYVFIIALCVAMCFYALALLRSPFVGKWTDYLALGIVGVSVIGLVLGFAFTSLFGFRLFVFSFSIWILVSGLMVYRFHQS